MSQGKRFVLLILISGFGVLNCEPRAFAQEAPILLVVHQRSDLVDAALSRGRPSAIADLRSGTALIGLRRGEFGVPPRPGWRVVTLGEPPQSGWVGVGVVMPFETRAKELKATAISLRAIGSGDKQQTFPELILTQSNPAIRQAWQDVAVAVSENEALPENERLPEPYFARAEIWSSVSSYSDALQDYLTGIKYARKSNRDLLSYSDYFDKFYDVAEKLQAVPVPPAGADSEPSWGASRHYGQGYTQFFSGDLRGALNHFDSAVRLAPDQPLYWYFRALTHRRLGDGQRAQFDVLMGAYFERQLTPWHRRSLDRSLTRVQGQPRTWLEAFRLGSPNNHLLQAYDIRFRVTGESQ